MRYVQLGNTGLRVSPICVGCMSYGVPAGRLPWALGEEAALPVLDEAYRAGLNFFDTADTYSGGYSEQILGKAIKKYGWRRENIVIATKCFAPVALDPNEVPHNMSEHERDNKGYLNAYGLSRKHIFEACEASLKRLGLDYIDLYQIHRYDKNTPAAEVMGALNDLVRMGKVRYIGASSMWAHQLCELQYTARQRGWAEFVTMQNLHHPAYREEEREMFPACGLFGIAGIPWSPLAMGTMARPWKKLKETQRGEGLQTGMMGRPLDDQDKAINEAIEAIATARGTSMAIVCLAWCLSKPFVHSPIVGLSSKDRIDEAVKATEFQLTDEEIKRIDDLYKIPRVIMGHS